MNLFAKLFAPIHPAEPPCRMLAMTWDDPRDESKFQVVGSVWRGMKLLNRTNAVQCGESARVIKDEWESNMRAAFPEATVVNCVVREARALN